MLSEVKAAFQGAVVETPIVGFNECAYISFALRLLHGKGSYGRGIVPGVYLPFCGSVTNRFIELYRADVV